MRAMWRCLIGLVSFVLLVVTVVSIVSPWFGLHPTTIRTSRRAIFPSVAIPFFFQSALPDSSFFLSKRPTLQSRQAYDIVARDCVRLC